MLYAHRLRCAATRANQPRLQLSTVAYVILRTLRAVGLNAAGDGAVQHHPHAAGESRPVSGARFFEAALRAGNTGSAGQTTDDRSGCWAGDYSGLRLHVAALRRDSLARSASEGGFDVSLACASGW